MLLTHKIKLDLTKDQTIEIENISNESRVLYNHFLSKLIEEYKQNKKFISYYILQKELKDYECEYLTFDVKKEVLRNLYDNYSSFFKLIKHNRELNPKTPKFRGIKYFFTLSFVQDFIIDDKNLILSYKGRKKIKIPLSYTEPIKELVCISNKSKSDIKQVKIFKKNDKFYASIVYLKQEDIEKVVDNNNILSIDLGKKNLLTVYDVLNNSATIYNSKYLSKNQKHLDKRTDELKSKRDLKQKYSLKYKQINNKIKKLQSKKKTQTKLTIHKVSKNLSNENKTILIGDLTNLKNKTKTKIRKINRQMQNNWNLQTFVHLLQYKNKLKGNQVIKVNEAWTSKTCCKCGEINHDLDLSDRQYICDCGNNLNRDVNGAINIYKHYVGDYNPPFDTLKVSERFGWCNINQMNKNY